MSIPVFSCVSGEAEKLKSNGIEISVGEDLDENKRVNITREDEEEVKFNNLYNTAEIDERILGQHFDLKGFPDITTYEDGVLHVIIDGNTLEDTRAKNFKELYKVIKTNIENIKYYLNSIDGSVLETNDDLQNLKDAIKAFENEQTLTNEHISILVYYVNEFLKSSMCIECIESYDNDDKLYINKLTYTPSSTPTPPPAITPGTTPSPTPLPTPLPSPTPSVSITPSSPTENYNGAIIDNSTCIAYYPADVKKENNKNYL